MADAKPLPLPFYGLKAAEGTYKGKPTLLTKDEFLDAPKAHLAMCQKQEACKLLQEQTNAKTPKAAIRAKENDPKFVGQFFKRVWPRNEEMDKDSRTRAWHAVLGWCKSQDVDFDQTRLAASYYYLPEQSASPNASSTQESNEDDHQPHMRRMPGGFSPDLGAAIGTKAPAPSFESQRSPFAKRSNMDAPGLVNAADPAAASLQQRKNSEFNVPYPVIPKQTPELAKLRTTNEASSPAQNPTSSHEIHKPTFQRPSGAADLYSGSATGKGKEKILPDKLSVTHNAGHRSDGDNANAGSMVMEYLNGELRWAAAELQKK